MSHRAFGGACFACRLFLRRFRGGSNSNWSSKMHTRTRRGTVRCTGGRSVSAGSFLPHPTSDGQGPPSIDLVPPINHNELENRDESTLTLPFRLTSFEGPDCFILKVAAPLQSFVNCW